MMNSNERKAASEDTTLKRFLLHLQTAAVKITFLKIMPAIAKLVHMFPTNFAEKKLYYLNSWSLIFFNLIFCTHDGVFYVAL